MDYSQLTVISFAVALIALLLVVVSLLRLKSQARLVARELAQSESRFKQLKLELTQALNQREEDHARSVALAKHIQDLQLAQTQLENQLREAKQQDPSMRLYQRAADLVKQGASLEEVMQACDLPRAEAELMMSLHRQP
ncbi:DUF2802 domain-containing protein [Alteromonas aestuariivivens]|uniref:DUF2802 domain-containing protein n=1 Tax=Alteromonas aestuariivivens TaxID=1938339 RepID=A0A3D8M5R7_9ALTE|nr:DUF2802 domain-containing protein [Alteromonas aestuariivivens]RDV25093.1 DUF2802 domain-containing protein [Alteromonas aestuariivivens]